MVVVARMHPNSPVNAHAGDMNCVMWHPRDRTCLVSCGDDGASEAVRNIEDDEI